MENYARQSEDWPLSTLLWSSLMGFLFSAIVFLFLKAWLMQSVMDTCKQQSQDLPTQCDSVMQNL
jgi:hypothetical protein